MIGKTKISRIYLAALIGLSGAGYAGTAIKTLRRPQILASQKIQKPQGAYHGAHLNHFIHPCYTAPFEKMAGQKLDIEMRFVDLKNLFFPADEAEHMKKRGGALYLVLEPRLDRHPLPLLRINKGDFDEELKSFAEQIKDFEGPLFLSFRPQRGSSYNPIEIAETFRYIREKLKAEGATNITWVASVPLDEDFSGEIEADWILVSIYQTGDDSTDKLLNKLTQKIESLKKHGKPIMIEFGSSAKTSIKSEFIKTLIGKIKGLGVKALILNNVSQLEGTALYAWELATTTEKEAYREALLRFGIDFKENVIISGGEMEREEDSEPSPEECRDLDGYFTAEQHQALRQLKKEIERMDTWVWRSRYYSKKRIELAKAFIRLAQLTSKLEYLDEAERVIKNADQMNDEKFQFHPSRKYVRDYFEVLFEIAEVKSSRGNWNEAIKLYERIQRELRDKNLKISQLIHEYSVPGYRNRANLELGYIYLDKGEFERARPLFEEVRSWAGKEAKRSIITLWWKKENRKDLRFLESRAALGLSRIALSEGHPARVIPLLKQILSYDESFSKKGFMDIGIESLIHLMRAYLLDDPERARLLFNHELDWSKIDQQDDFKNALNLEDVDLSSDKVDKWEKILFGLSMVTLPDYLNNELAIINSYNK